MKKLSTVLATVIAGLTITSTALAFQTTSTPPPWNYHSDQVDEE